MSVLENWPWVFRLHAWWHGSRVNVRGKGSRVERAQARLIRTQVNVTGVNSRVILEPGCRLWDCAITVVGDDCEVIVGRDCRLRIAQLVVEDRGSRLHLGAETSMTGAALLAQEGGLVRLGRDCMIGKETNIRNSDSHGLHAADGRRLNPARDVLIGDHVWLGIDVFVCKGAKIGDGAMVGACSMVSGELPAKCLAVGRPAVPVKADIRWTRTRDEK